MSCRAHFAERNEFLCRKKRPFRYRKENLKRKEHRVNISFCELLKIREETFRSKTY